MKKIICFILGSFFILLGFIGLLLPIIPQIPFFVAGIVLLSSGSERIRNKIKNSKFYKMYLEDRIINNKLLRKLLKNFVSE